MPNAMGLCMYQSDVIKLKIPNFISSMLLPSIANTISHEIAHFVIEEYYEGYIPAASCYQWANRLVHYACNMANVRGDRSYLKPLKYWTPIFRFQYGFNGVQFDGFDVAKLVRDRGYIIDQIDRGLAPIGKDAY